MERGYEAWLPDATQPTGFTAWSTDKAAIFKSGTVLDSTVRIQHKQVTYTFSGERLDGNAQNPGQAFTVVLKDKDDLYHYRSDGNGSDLKWVTSIAQHNGTANANVPTAKHWLCGVHWIFVQAIQGSAQAYTERPMVESSDIAGGYSHPSANLPSNWNLAKPPVFRKRLSSGSSTIPFSEVVSIDVRKAQ